MLLLNTELATARGMDGTLVLLALMLLGPMVVFLLQFVLVWVSERLGL